MEADPLYIELPFFPKSATFAPLAEKHGFRLGAKGTHTSRTMMFTELAALLREVKPECERDEYADNVILSNVLAKATFATRKLTNQRLGELYGLDPKVPPFRVLRKLWDIESSAQPQLALLLAVARDPILMGTADYIISMKLDDELSRTSLKESISNVVSNRLNDSILDKVARNVASTWAQSGHLVGRTFKIRTSVKPNAVSIAFALYMGHLAGLRSDELLKSGWVRLLDCNPVKARELAFEATRLQLIDVRAPGDYLEFSFDRIDPWKKGNA